MRLKKWFLSADSISHSVGWLVCRSKLFEKSQTNYTTTTTTYITTTTTTTNITTTTTTFATTTTNLT